MFPDAEHTFTDAKHMFSDAEYTFSVGEHKFSGRRSTPEWGMGKIFLSLQRPSTGIPAEILTNTLI